MEVSNSHNTACMSAKRTSWNEFSSSMASILICLSTGRKFNFSKYIFDSLVRNVDSSTKFYMYPRFLQLMIRAQVGDLSSYSTKYSSPAPTQKVFANIRRVEKGFYGVETPLFEGMIVVQQVGEGDDEVHVEDVSTAGVAAEGAASVTNDKVPTVVDEPSIPSPPPPTQPPPPSQDIPSTSQVQPTPPLSPIAQPQSPQHQPQPSQDVGISMDLLQNLLDTCTTLTRRGKEAESQAQIYQIDLEHADKEKLQQLEQWAYLSTHLSKRFNSFCYDDDDDEDYTIAVTPSLLIEEPDNSLIMGDEHLDTIPSSVENLIPISSESEGIPEQMCDVPFHDNYPPLDVSKDQFEDFSESNDEFFSTDDDSFSIDKIDYVEASPPDSELVSSDVMEIVIPEVGGIDDDILLTIKDDILRENLLNVNLLIAKIEALNANPTPSSDARPKISSGSTTTHSDISLSEYEAFYDDHVKEISSGSPTTHSDSSLYASFIFDLSINPFPPADRSDFYKFTDELIPFISPSEYDCFLFTIEPNSGDFTKDVVEDISPTKEPQVHNALPTHPTLQLNMKFQPSSEYLFTYVVWIFLSFLVYSVAPHYLLSLRNEDTIFDPGIYNSYFLGQMYLIGVELSIILILTVVT
nr:hypothetical protein [Tanacetum cinerariifolium]